ncbi:MAG: SGNH/GDSL hydrolase family protein [Candidatus Omnitrophica bacterium]|nr:SGNH/GDSL hydrolase family protein [Candidatus Omnitrophota bacterium]
MIRFKNLIKDILLAFMLLLVLCVIAELYLRVYVAFIDRINPYKDKKSYMEMAIIYAKDETLWEVPFLKYKKNCSLRLGLKNGKSLDIQTDRFGYRTKDFNIQKPKGMIRVVCIGGSTTIEGISNSKTYPAILEEKLKNYFNTDKIEVLNIAVSGWRTKDILQEFDWILSLSPDYIIKYSGVNDISWEYFPYLNNTNSFYGRLFTHSYLFQWFFMKTLFPNDYVLCADINKRYMEPVKEMAIQAKRKGVDLILVTFVAPDISGLNKFQRYFLDQKVRECWGVALGIKNITPYLRILSIYNKELKRLSEELNITSIDLNKLFPSDNFDLFADICHMTQEGIEKKAEIIFEAMKIKIKEDARK